MRDLARACVEALVSSDELDGVVDMLRVWTSGLTLTALEHPGLWSRERLRDTVDLFIDSLDLSRLDRATTATRSTPPTRSAEKETSWNNP